MQKKLPELLLPAGSLQKAITAFRYGADAVYAGVPAFSMRTRENVMTESELAEIVKLSRDLSKKNPQNPKKVYATVNIFPRENIIEPLKKHLKFLASLDLDGIILADLAVLQLAKEICPNLPKHLSVQTSTMNSIAIKKWQDLGISRIICAREMSIKEVAQIIKKVPDMEMEYFVHGSVCMAYSGRCLLSCFTGGRDANSGACNHTCRWCYQVLDENSREILAPENIHKVEHSALIEEEKRRGEFFGVEEDFHGSHIMSSRDMCMIEILDEIIEAGICSIKVEGRNKSEYYVATIARAYRQALDNYSEKIKEGTKKLIIKNQIWDEIHATANRGFFPGFAHGQPLPGTDIQYEENRSTGKKEVCGIVQNWKDGRAQIKVKNRIEEGNKIEFVMPKIKDDFEILAKNLMLGETKVSVLHGGNNNEIASIQCDKEIKKGIFIRQKI